MSEHVAVNMSGPSEGCAVLFKNNDGDQRDGMLCDCIAGYLQFQAVPWNDDTGITGNFRICVPICSSLVFGDNPEYMRHVLQKLEAQNCYFVFVVSKALYSDQNIKLLLKKFAQRKERVVFIADKEWENEDCFNEIASAVQSITNNT